MACRLRRANEDAVRILHETQLHERSSFLTLTYDQEHLPPDHGLHVRDWQLFMKRLRKRTDNKLRFYMVGEYGDRDLRPHFHAIIFGEDWRREWKPIDRSDAGHLVYQAETVQEAWGQGRTSVDAVTFQNAAYCARYHQKKIKGEAANDHYLRCITDDDGELQLVNVRPEFSCRSMRPGIGSGWYDKFKRDLFPLDECIVQGQRMPVPTYYRNKLKNQDPALYESLKAKRREAINDAVETEERARTRAFVLKARTAKLRRTL